MQSPEPVLIGDLFPAERARLLELLAGLTPEQWLAPTACAGWTVKDVAAHLLADDLGRLSRGRDRFASWAPVPGEPVLAFVNRQNAEWVQAMRRVSPAIIGDLLRWAGEQTAAYFASLDPYQIGPVVSWVGPEPGPVWLDLAREYTERWHHHQHIREAVGAPGLTEPRFFQPVLATFVHALPYALRLTATRPRAAVQLHLAGPSGGDWSVVRGAERWTLYAGAAESPAARVTLAEDLAWRLFTRGITPEQAARRATIDGQQRLGRVLLEAVAIIV
jgi:uncharacterized protein (TIGR03083 family)